MPTEPRSEIYSGKLDIDYEHGIIIFQDANGKVLLRVTHLKQPFPVGSQVDVVALEKLTSYTALGYEAEIIREVCQVCKHIHNDNGVDVFKVHGEVIFRPGHDYIITTKTPAQRHPRVWRMGYIGRTLPDSPNLQFSARGPDRVQSGKYAGTVVIDSRTIVGQQEVDVDYVKRHIEEVKKP